MFCSIPPAVHDPQLACVLKLQAWVLQRQLAILATDSNGADTARASAAMAMLQSICRRAASLADNGQILPPGIEAACHAMRLQLEKAVGLRAHLIGQGLHLPSPSSIDNGTCHIPGWALPPGEIPAQAALLDASAGLEAAQKRAAQNLGSLPLLPQTSSFARTLEWLKLPACKHDNVLTKLHR
jgi:hypothetical protein